MSATVDTALTLRQMMRERLALSEEADPHLIAQELLDDLSEDFKRDVILAGLVSMLRQEISSNRRRIPLPSPSPRHSREQFREAAALWDVYSLQFPTADDWKFLGDLTREDAVWNGEQYEQRAGENLAWASRFHVLAKRLTRGRTVREALSREDVEAILSA